MKRISPLIKIISLNPPDWLPLLLAIVLALTLLVSSGILQLAT